MALDTLARTAPHDGHGVERDVVLNGQYEIYPHEPIAPLTSRGVEAFRAVDRRFPTVSCAALVCSGETAPRVDAMTSLRGLSKPALLGVLAFGPVNWPDGRQRLAVIHSAPNAGKFALTVPLKPAQVVEALLRPMAAALHDIHARGTTHRAIRPDNLFMREPGATTLTLGPCVTTPPGFGQPDIYEPVHTAIADPAARGNGTAKDDMFALGMTALALLLGRQPGSEYDRDTLMIRRLELGSLGAVVERSSMPREIIDALDGLTADDESERWTVVSLQKWLNGGRPDQPRSYDASHALVPYQIAGKAVRNARSLAYALGQHWVEGVRHLREEALTRWLRDYAPERTAAPMLDHALSERELNVEGDDNDALMVSRAIMVLDPEGPIRFRGAAVQPHGLGPYIYEAMKNPEKRAAATGLLRYGLPQRMLDRRGSERRASARRVTRQAINFERLRRWAQSSEPWEGLERCLYDLNRDVPCLSPMTGGRWVSGVEDLIGALDAYALTGAATEPTLDAHLAAFIGARFEAAGDTLLTLMKPREADSDATLGAIRLFAELQQSYASRPLRGITQWCATLARRVAEQIHHRPSRQKLIAAIEQAAPLGNVATILKIVDVPGLRQRDERAFSAARNVHAQLSFEIQAIERGVEARRARAQQRGRDNAALLSAAGSVAMSFLTLMLDNGR